MDRKKGNTQKIVISLLVIVVLVLVGALFLNGKDKNNSNSINNNVNKVTSTPSLTSTTGLTPTSTSTASPSTASPSPTSESTATPEVSPTISVSVTPNASVTPTATPITSITPVVSKDEVRVYYSVDPDSYDVFQYAFYFDIYLPPGSNAGEYALTKLIEGPTAEQASEYKTFTPVKLSGASNCGKDFDLKMDTAKRTATIQFCKDIASNGVGDDARIQTVVTKTLEDTLGATKVIILTKDGDCFGDQSGLNQCKE